MRDRAVRLRIAIIAVTIALAATLVTPRGSAPTALANTWPVEQLGSTGPDAYAVQYLLQAWGYTIGVDGIFGSQTQSVVKQFQSAHGLTADRIVGLQTWPVLVITVQQGSNGPAVKAVQTLLNDVDNAGLAVDGIFGPATYAAVTSFQQTHGLAVDGIVGQNTWSALVNAAAGSSPTPTATNTPGATATPTNTPGPRPTATPTSTPVSGSPPAASTSRYMATVSTGTLNGEGCSQANQTGVVILDFGEPWAHGKSYGTLLYDAGNTFVTTTQIQSAVEAWLSGYWTCGHTATVRLGVGTSNYGPDVTATLGQKWSQMINNIGAWISNSGYASRETIAGANDIEPSWSTSSAARSWIKGYVNGANGQQGTSWSYLNYGSCDGCPSKYTPGPPSNGWTEEDLWYVTAGTKDSLGVPEIYYNAPPGTDTNASQWEYVSQYGVSNHGAAIAFQADLTQYAACNGGCNPPTNTPAQGWTQLQNEMNSSTGTAFPLNAATDITWAN